MDFEEDLEFYLTEDKFIGGESDADFKKRMDLRNGYVATCNKGKTEFGHTIGKANSMMKKLANDNVNNAKKALNQIDDQLASRANTYNKQVTTFVASNQDMISSAD